MVKSKLSSRGDCWNWYTFLFSGSLCSCTAVFFVVVVIIGCTIHGWWRKDQGSLQPSTTNTTPNKYKRKAATQLHHGSEYHKVYHFHQLQSGKNLDSTINYYFHLLINVSLNKRIQCTNLQQHKDVPIDDCGWLNSVNK